MNRSKQGLYNIHDEFQNLSKNLRFPRKPITISVYIPSVHVRYTNSAIFHVFDMKFGIVDRIDTVSVKTEDGKSTNFKSVFVYFIVPSDNTVVTEIQERGSIRINPNINTDYMNKHFYQTNNKIRNSEFWILLPNNSVVPYTNLSLDQIEAKMTELEHKVVSDVEELAALNANREFLVELRSKQNREMPPYKDNSINVHQLAQNIKLMEDRVELLQKEVPKKNSLRVNNLNENCVEGMLWDCFVKKGNLMCIKLFRDANCGYILYQNNDDAESALSGIDLSEIGGDKCNVEWSDYMFCLC